MNADLREGITDGAVKKDAPDRGGVVEFDAHMQSTLQQQYGMTFGFGPASEVALRQTSLR
jgi:hypothetical protein